MQDTSEKYLRDEAIIQSLASSYSLPIAYSSALFSSSTANFSAVDLTIAFIFSLTLARLTRSAILTLAQTQWESEDVLSFVVCRSP